MLHEEDSVDSPLSIHLHPTELLSSEARYYYESLSDDDQYLYNQSRIKRYYYHRDHQNSIIALSDHNAQIVEYYEYDIYGNITKNEHTEGIQTLNPYRYTGREFDSDDLYYYRARYYDPTIGRFITPDPIGFLGGDTNFYRYVGNDPVNFTDPSGLAVFVLTLAPEAIAGVTALGTRLAPYVPRAIAAIRGANTLAKVAPKDATIPMQDPLNPPAPLIAAQPKATNAEKVGAGSGVKVASQTETKSKDVNCGDKGPYKDQKNPAKQDLERDHIPSKQLVKDWGIEELKKEMGNVTPKLKNCIENFIENNMKTLAIPKSVHSKKTSRTNPGNMPDNVRKSKTDNLPQTAREEAEVVEDEVNKQMDSHNPCAKKIKEELKGYKNMKQEEFDDLLDKAVENCNKRGIK